MDVQCTCGAAFCWTCQEEAHRPVACETVRKWLIKNSAESENMNWILANTKPCPDCKRPIEKNMAGGVLRTRSRPTLNRRTKSARLHEHSHSR